VAVGGIPGGRTGEVVDGRTGEIIPVQNFVAVLGASSFTYAEATWSQKLPDWIAAHVRAFTYFGGAARQTVSDNLKAGIIKACFYEPMVNRTYADLARHYGTAIDPARPYKPRDKAKVEVGVQVVGRWILARLRRRRFFSLAELNAAIRALLDELNDRPMRVGHEPAGALCSARPACARAAAVLSLRIRRVEALPGQPRLPRRDC
jgi:transposase